MVDPFQMFSFSTETKKKGKHVLKESFRSLVFKLCTAEFECSQLQFYVLYILRISCLDWF